MSIKLLFLGSVFIASESCAQQSASITDGFIRASGWSRAS